MCGNSVLAVEGWRKWVNIEYLDNVLVSRLSIVHRERFRFRLCFRATAKSQQIEKGKILADLVEVILSFDWQDLPIDVQIPRYLK